MPEVPWLTLVLLLSALVVAGAMLHKIPQVWAAAHTPVVAETIPYQLQQQRLSPAEYKAVIAWLQRLHPDVTLSVAADKEGISLKITEPSDHAAWLYALTAIQARDSDVIWTADEFCVAHCAGGAAYARVTGYRQHLSVGS